MVVVVVVVLVAWCLVVVVAGDVRGHRVSWPVGWIAWGARPIPCGCESVIRPISRFAEKRSDMGPAFKMFPYPVLKFRILFLENGRTVVHFANREKRHGCGGGGGKYNKN